MINHTMIVSFPQSTADTEVDQFLADLEKLMRDSGTIQSFVAARAIHVPADEHSPVMKASAIVQLGLTDIDALNASFAVPGTEELIQRWQSRHPYKVVWVNHEPLS